MHRTDKVNGKIPRRTVLITTRRKKYTLIKIVYIPARGILE